MSSAMFTRRHVLGGLGAGAALLPFLPVLNSEAEARGEQFPKRLVIWFYPNGTLPEKYFPAGEELTLTPILAPMERHLDDCIVMKGVTLKSYEPGIKIGHISCVAPLLTGFTLLDGDQNEGAKSYGWAGGPSVDQVLAQRIGSETLFPSLEFHNVGMKDEFRTQYRVFYSGANQPLTGMRHPSDAFRRIFEGSGLATDAMFVRNELSVLDNLKDDLNRLRARLPVDERPKLDAHLESVREVEKRLQAAPLACDPERPTLLDGIDGFEDGTCGKHDNSPEGCLWDKYYDEVIQSHMDVMVEAMTCDATRVLSLQNGAGGRGHKFTGWDNAGGDEHVMSHAQPDRYAEVKAWYMERLATFVDKLKAVPEGDGTLFDNTLILACSEHGVGKTHSNTNVPFMTVGGKWAFRTGKYHQFDGVSNNNLLLSICDAMGQEEMTSFGDPNYCTGRLNALHL